MLKDDIPITVKISPVHLRVIRHALEDVISHCWVSEPAKEEARKALETIAKAKGA